MTTQTDPVAPVARPALTVRSQGAVVTVDLDLPDGLLPLATAGELTELLRRPPEGAHVLVLRSRGDSFCLGRERTAATAHELPGEVDVLVQVNDALARSPLVSLAVVGGDAAGFGVGLAALCDVSVAVDTARFCFPEVGIGLAPALVLAWLEKVVGRRQAFWLTATGEQVDAARAVGLGLLNEAVPAADLEATVQARVQALLRHSPRVHAEIRDMLRVAAGMDVQQAHELARDRLVVGSLRRGA